MRLCIERNEEQTFWKGEMGQYEILAICNEIAHDMVELRSSGKTPPREEAAVLDIDAQKLCVEYIPGTQQFSWTRNGLSALDTEIMCLIVIGEIYASWQK